MSKSFQVPPLLAQYAAGAVRTWQSAFDRHDGCQRAYSEAVTALTKAERELRAASKAIALALATDPRNAQSGVAPATPEAPGGDTLTSDMMLAWMQAGSPVDDQGNMVFGGGGG